MPLILNPRLRLHQPSDQKYVVFVLEAREKENDHNRCHLSPVRQTPVQMLWSLSGPLSMEGVEVSLGKQPGASPWIWHSDRVKLEVKENCPHYVDAEGWAAQEPIQPRRRTRLAL